ncbi:lipopolysaccharide kinase InaA family protein [Lentisphaerota bacterium ZTH]|nr:hypothetical protein JYG24_02255 [Lentisphaerota bacterium]WET07666.1 lipopolysaccharide kinase InaA family protein [Lentisphaerota bacterium ZTH]
MSSLIAQILDHCRSGGSDFYSIKSGRVNGLVARSLPASDFDSINNPDTLFNLENLTKDSVGTTAGPVVIAGRNYFLKRYNNRNIKHRIKNSLRLAKPFKVLAASVKFREAGVFVPEVIAALEKRKALLVESSYLLTEMLHEIHTAANQIENIVKNLHEEAFIQSTCTSLAKIHSEGIVHGDPKMTNLLISAKGNSFETGFLDLDGAILSENPVPDSLRIKELARVISSWLKTCRDLRLPHDKLDVLVKKYAESYLELAGVDLFGNKLLDRTEYLVKRVRKR